MSPPSSPLSPGAVTFSSWEPGVEYTKNLVLKNTLYKMAHIRITHPSSRAFSTTAPMVIKISPGTAVTIPIVFSPKLKLAIEDEIEVETSEGTFEVCLKATLPVASLACPATVWAPLVSIGEVSTTSFQLENTSALTTTWMIACPAPFTASPTSGELAPGTKGTIDVKFNPQTAGVCEGIVPLKFDGGGGGTGLHTIRFFGNAKFPHIKASWKGAPRVTDTGAVDFGETLVGQPVCRELLLKNVSPVLAEYKILRRNSGADARFSVSKDSGLVYPGKTAGIKVRPPLPAYALPGTSR